MGCRATRLLGIKALAPSDVHPCTPPCASLLWHAPFIAATYMCVCVCPQCQVAAHYIAGPCLLSLPPPDSLSHPPPLPPPGVPSH